MHNRREAEVQEYLDENMGVVTCLDDIMAYLPTDNVCLYTDAEWSIWSDGDKLLCSDEETAYAALEWIDDVLETWNHTSCVKEESGAYIIMWDGERDEE